MATSARSRIALRPNQRRSRVKGSNRVRRRLGIEPLEIRNLLAGITTPSALLFAPDANSGSLLREFATDESLLQSFEAYDPSFAAGVRIAVGDIDADGTMDIVTGTGPGVPTEIKVINGLDGSTLTTLQFKANHVGGVFVAAGDVNNDGFDDIIAGEDAGGGSLVRVISGADFTELVAFEAYTGKSAGVRVASGDISGDGWDDIITALGPGESPLVNIFSGFDFELTSSFSAMPIFTGGVYLASGDINGDLRDDVVIGAGEGGFSAVLAFSGADGTQLAQFFAYGPLTSAAVRVAVTDFDGDGKDDIVTGLGPGEPGEVKVFSGANGSLLANFFAYESDFDGGVFVAAVPESGGADTDQDGVSDESDNCPTIHNTDQSDGNGNNIGDVCEQTGGGGVPIPDEAALVYESFDGQNGPFGAKLFVTSDPADEQNVTVCVMVDNACDLEGGSEAEWSPDGKRILFRRPDTQTLWVLDTETGKQRPVVDALGGNIVGQTPTWAGSSGNAISYAGVVESNFDIMHATIAFFDDRVEIVSETNLTNNPANDRSPSWSADGAKLVFQSDRSGAGDIYLIANVANPNPVNLTAERTSAGDFEPDLSPDGTKIVFASSSGGFSDIWVMNVDGSNPIQLTDDHDSDSAPAWSPDSQRIAFSSTPNFMDDGEIIVMNADGLDRTPITNNQTFEWNPDWRPIPVVPSTDLLLEIEDDEDPIVQGNNAVFRMKVTNNGPITATGVTITTEPLPESAVFHFVRNIGNDCTQGEDRRVTCTFDHIFVNASKHVDLDLILNAKGPFELTATVTANEEDPDQENNQDSETVTVSPSADLSVFFTDTAEQRDDVPFNYVVEFRNNGPNSANVHIETQLDPRLEFVSVDPPRDGIYGCSHADGLVTCDFQQVAEGHYLGANIRVRSIRPGTMTSHTTISSDDAHDLFTFNDQDEISTIVRPEHDHFLDALTVGGLSGSVNSSNVHATRQTTLYGTIAEPQHVANTPSSTSVWYRWTAHQDGKVTINTVGSTFDTLLAAYFVVGDIFHNGTLHKVGSNDDTDGRTSQITFDVFESQEYYIAVDGYNGATGSFSLNWSQIPEIKPTPQPQKINSLEPSSVLVGSSPELHVTLHGSGFNEDSRIFVYPSGQACNSLGGKIMPSTFRNNDRILETFIPASYLQNATTLKIGVTRGSNQSNCVDFNVSERLTLPFGTDLALGLLRLGADFIQQLGGLLGGEAEDGEEVYSAQGNVQFNDYLSINGSNIEVRINRSANSMRLRIQQGSVRLHLPRYGQVTLWSGDDFEFTVDGSGQLTNLLRARVETPLREKGIDLSISQAKLLLGSQLDGQGRPIYGIEILGSLKFQRIVGLVDLPLSFNKLVLTQNEGMRFSGDIGPIDFTIANTIGIEDFTVGFVAGATPQEDVFRGSGKVFIGRGAARFGAGGGIEVKGGKLNSFSGDVELPGGIGIPLGPVNLTGGVLELKNLLDIRNLEVFVGADLTILHPSLDKVVALDDAGIRYFAPARLKGEANLELFGVDAANAFIDIDMNNNRYGFGGGVDLLPQFPIFVVQGELYASVNRNDGLSIEGFAEGIVQIPDGTGPIYDFLKSCAGAFGFQVGPCVSFPMEIASAKVSYYNRTFSYTTSLPVVGKVVLRVKQTQDTFQAIVDLFHNVPVLPKQLVFGSGEAGESSPTVVGTVTVGQNAPKAIFNLMSPNGSPLFDLIDPNGTRITPATAAAHNASYFENNESKDSFFVVENPIAGVWTLEAHPGVSGPFELEAWGPNVAPEVNDIGISAVTDGYDISYNVVDPDDDSLVSLYYSTSPIDPVGKLIASGLPESAAGSFVWKPTESNVPSGEYYIYARAEDTLNTPAIRFTTEKVTVINPLAPVQPQGVVVTPQENSLKVSWSANSESDLAGYQVWYAIDNDSAAQVEVADAGLGTSLQLINLAPNTKYRVWVAAYDESERPDPDDASKTITENLFSLPSAAVVATTSAASPPVVELNSPADGIKLLANSDIDVTWSVGQADDLYLQQIYISTDGGTSYELLAEVDPDVRDFSWHIPASLPSSSIRLKVLASDEAGNVGQDSSDLDLLIQSPGSFVFHDATYSIGEGETKLIVTVDRIGGTAGVATVDLITRNGTATVGSDFLAVTAGRLVFFEGETSQTIEISIVNDGSLESPESFELRLRNPTGGASLGTQTISVVTIVDNDTVADSDGDGIDDATESRGPNSGDGNSDEIPDRDQPNVASVEHTESGDFVIISAASGQTVRNARQVTNPDSANDPDEIAFPIGFVAFEITVANAGDSAAIEFKTDSTSPINIYYQYGSSPTNPQPHWYMYHDAFGGGANLQADRVVVTVKDGGKGDGDNSANGVITILAALGSNQRAKPWQNPFNRLDVNADGFIAPGDVLIVINELNNVGARALAAPPLAPNIPTKYVDVSGDNNLAPIDALQIINDLNNNGSRATGNSAITGGEAEPVLDWLEVHTPVAQSSPTIVLPSNSQAAAGSLTQSPLRMWTNTDDLCLAVGSHNDAEGESAEWPNWVIDDSDDDSDELFELLATELVKQGT